MGNTLRERGGQRSQVNQIMNICSIEREEKYRKEEGI